MNDYNPNAGERIPQQQREEMMAAFSSQYSNVPTVSNHFGKHCFEELLALPGATNIVTALGADAEGNVHLIHSAADDEGNLIRDEQGQVISFEIGEICPPKCN